jgi:hypothetical protein
MAEYHHALRPYRSLMSSFYAESIHLLGHGLGVTIDDVDTQHEVVPAVEDFAVRAGPIAAGTAAGARWTFTGTTGGRPVVTIEVVHKADARRVFDWCEPGYSLRLDGHPSISLAGGPDWVSNGIGAAASHALNAIPLVCAAPPGIQTVLDLPLITARS